VKRLALALPVVLSLGCRQVAGIGPITYSGGDGGGGGCTNATAVLSSSEALALVSVSNGFVSAGVLDSDGFAIANIVACPIGTTCMQAKNLLTPAFGDHVEAYAAASQLYYTLQASTTGSVHSVAYDGTGDQSLLANATSPTYIAVSGARTFWTSDDLTGVASLHCVGCGTGDQTWISSLGTPYGVLTDASNVYVVADDGSGGTNGIYACSVSTACNTNPRTVITGLPSNASFPAVEVATDGANVYVSNDSTEIHRVGPTGTQTSVIKGVAALAIEVDAATGDLFYATDDGTIARTKADGTGTPVPLSTCDPGNPNDVWDIAFDATYVYVLVAPTTGASTVYAVKR